MDLGISGKRAAVAAASQGLGRATAAALAAEGVQVAICSRSREQDRSRRRRHPGSRSRSSPTCPAKPVRRSSSATPATRSAASTSWWPTAGDRRPGTFASTDLALYSQAFEANCLAVVAMCLEAVPAMQAQGGGRVLAITSVSVRQPIPALILSNTARAGVTGFLKTLAREVAADGVTANSIQPGSHDTERIRVTPTATRAATARGRIGDPDDFGRIAAFLCSESAKFITGAAVNVDGGAYQGLHRRSRAPTL